MAKFECLYIQELPAPSQNQDDPTLRAGLPSLLLQPKDNYQLIFREEFSGEGFASLDPSLWITFPEGTNPGCRSTVTGGYYAFTKNSSQDCPPHKISTAGKFEYQFGYLEMRVRIPIKRHASYTNFAFVLWSRYSTFGASYRTANFANLNQYDLLSLDTPEIFSRYIGGETDLMEYSGRIFYFGGNRNAGFDIPSYDVPVTSLTNEIVFCSKSERTDAPIYFDWYDQNGPCNTDTYDESLVDIVYGYEWTPAGKKFLYKIEGIHSDFQLYPINLFSASSRKNIDDSSPHPTEPELSILKIGYRQRLQRHSTAPT